MQLATQPPPAMPPLELEAEMMDALYVHLQLLRQAITDGNAARILEHAEKLSRCAQLIGLTAADVR